MIRRVFIVLVAALVLHGHKTASASTTGKAETLDCLTEMNEARTAAGLPAFGKASGGTQVLPPSSSSLREITADTLWNEICQEITGGKGDRTESKKLDGTFAYYAGAKDCTAAVQYWKDGFSLFKNELPPTYTTLGEPDVYTDRAVSFVALYNPKASPVASCAFVTCTTAGTFAAAARRPSSPSLRRLQDAQTKTAVICLTNPEALTDGEKPFKEDEWQKIVDAIVGPEESNGVSPIRPSLAVGLIATIFASALL